MLSNESWCGRNLLMEESTHWECSLPSCAFLTSHSQKLPPWFVHRGRQTRTSEPAFTEATVMEQWRDLIHGACLPIQLDKVNEGKYPLPGWSPMKEREMRRRNEERGTREKYSASQAEEMAVIQPNLSVWLPCQIQGGSHKITHFLLNTKRQWGYTHTHTHT